MCDHYTKLLTEEDRHYVIAPEFNNCVLCLVNDKGCMTQNEIADYLGVSKMRVSQIIKTAQKKMSNKIRFLEMKKYFTKP